MCAFVHTAYLEDAERVLRPRTSNHRRRTWTLLRRLDDRAGQVVDREQRPSFGRPGSFGPPRILVVAGVEVSDEDAALGPDQLEPWARHDGTPSESTRTALMLSHS